MLTLELVCNRTVLRPQGSFSVAEDIAQVIRSGNLFYRFFRPAGFTGIIFLKVVMQNRFNRDDHEKKENDDGYY